MEQKIINIADDLGVSPENLKEAIEKNKTISKRKYVVLGKSNIMTISGFKHLLPLYREKINEINEAENLRIFKQLAAREGVEIVEDFIEKMNTDAEYRTRILRKYKVD